MSPQTILTGSTLEQFGIIGSGELPQMGEILTAPGLSVPGGAQHPAPGSPTSTATPTAWTFAGAGNYDFATVAAPSNFRRTSAPAPYPAPIADFAGRVIAALDETLPKYERANPAYSGGGQAALASDIRKYFSEALERVAEISRSSAAQGASKTTGSSGGIEWSKFEDINTFESAATSATESARWRMALDQKFDAVLHLLNEADRNTLRTAAGWINRELEYCSKQLAQTIKLERPNVTARMEEAERAKELAAFDQTTRAKVDTLVATNLSALREELTAAGTDQKLIEPLVAHIGGLVRGVGEPLANGNLEQPKITPLIQANEQFSTLERTTGGLAIELGKGQYFALPAPCCRAVKSALGDLAESIVRLHRERQERHLVLSDRYEAILRLPERIERTTFSSGAKTQVVYHGEFLTSVIFTEPKTDRFIEVKVDPDILRGHIDGTAALRELKGLIFQMSRPDRRAEATDVEALKSCLRVLSTDFLLERTAVQPGSASTSTFVKDFSAVRVANGAGDAPFRSEPILPRHFEDIVAGMYGFKSPLAGVKDGSLSAVVRNGQVTFTFTGLGEIEGAPRDQPSLVVRTPLSLTPSPGQTASIGPEVLLRQVLRRAANGAGTVDSPRAWSVERALDELVSLVGDSRDLMVKELRGARLHAVKKGYGVAPTIYLAKDGVIEDVEVVGKGTVAIETSAQPGSGEDGKQVIRNLTIPKGVTATLVTSGMYYDCSFHGDIHQESSMYGKLFRSEITGSHGFWGEQLQELVGEGCAVKRVRGLFSRHARQVVERTGPKRA